MKRQQYYPSAAGQQVLWLNHYVSKLAGYAPALGVSPAECAASIADARWLIYVIGSWLPAVRAWAKSCTGAAARYWSAFPLRLPQRERDERLSLRTGRFSYGLPPRAFTLTLTPAPRRPAFAAEKVGRAQRSPAVLLKPVLRWAPLVFLQALPPPERG